MRELCSVLSRALGHYSAIIAHVIETPPQKESERPFSECIHKLVVQDLEEIPQYAKSLAENLESRVRSIFLFSELPDIINWNRELLNASLESYHTFLEECKEKVLHALGTNQQKLKELDREIALVKNSIEMLPTISP
jgi:hypothetical protein